MAHPVYRFVMLRTACRIWLPRFSSV